MSKKIAVSRFDFRPLEKAVKLDNGFLKAPVRATRTGVFRYIKADGTIVREYRPPEEVFSKDSMQTLAGVPVTNRHPTVLVDSRNAKKYSVGMTSDVVEQDDNFLKTSMTITDQDMIDEVETDGLREVSCGYKAEVEFVEGVTPEGEHYDAIQRNIRYNHLAIVDKGRAGPEVRLHLDADGAILDDEEIDKPKPKPKTEGNMAKVNLNGAEFEVDGGVATAINTALEKARKDGADQAQKEAKEKMDASSSDLQKKIDEQQAKIDGLEEDLKKAKEDKMDAKQLQQLVKDRAELVEKATKHLKKDTDVSEMTDMEIKKAVVETVCDGIDLTEKSEDYISARFDHICDSAPAKPAKDALKEGIKKVDENRGDEEEKSADEIRAERMKADSAAWEQPIGYSLN